MFSKGRLCSKVSSLRLMAGNHEDDAFVLTFFDKKGAVLGRIAGFPGIIGECQELE
jgi:hypothetical protein